MAGPSSTARGSSTGGALSGADAEEAARPVLADGETVDAPVTRRFGDERAGDDRGADLTVPSRQVRAEKGERQVETGHGSDDRGSLQPRGQDCRQVLEQRLRLAVGRRDASDRRRATGRSDLQRECLFRRRRLGKRQIPTADERRGGSPRLARNSTPAASSLSASAATETRADSRRPAWQARPQRRRIRHDESSSGLRAPCARCRGARAWRRTRSRATPA